MRTATSNKLTSLLLSSTFLPSAFSTTTARGFFAAAALTLGVGLSACGTQSDDYVGEAYDCVGNEEDIPDHDVVVLLDRHQNGDASGYFGSTLFKAGDALLFIAELDDVDFGKEDLAFESEINIGDNRVMVEVELEFARDGEAEGEIVYEANGSEIQCELELERE